MGCGGRAGFGRVRGWCGCSRSRPAAKGAAGIDRFVPQGVELSARQGPPAQGKAVPASARTPPRLRRIGHQGVSNGAAVPAAANRPQKDRSAVVLAWHRHARAGHGHWDRLGGLVVKPHR